MGSVDAPQGAVEVPFRLRLTEGLFGRIRGVIEDASDDAHVPSPGGLKGRRRSKGLAFTHECEERYVMTDSGPVEAREYYAQRFGLALPQDLPPAQIEFEGTIEDSGDRVVGFWWVPRERLPVEGGYATFGGADGTWEMVRTPVPAARP